MAFRGRGPEFESQLEGFFMTLCFSFTIVYLLHNSDVKVPCRDLGLIIACLLHILGGVPPLLLVVE